MRVLAYCAERYEHATRLVAGVRPLTSPPLTDETFDLAWLSGYDLIVFNLHGEPGNPAWYGQAREMIGPLPVREVALRAERLAQADLGGAVVFANNCYLADAGNPMMAALLAAGAGAVIAGAGKNYGARWLLAGADWLGLWLRLGLQRGLKACEALEKAKAILRWSLPVKPIRDALEFRLIEGLKHGDN